MRQIDVVSRIDMIASRWPMTSIASGEDNHKEDLKTSSEGIQPMVFFWEASSRDESSTAAEAQRHIEVGVRSEPWWKSSHRFI
jgi:hypothetical protein